MQVVLSFDYELFFGAETGTVQKCMIEPTNCLLQLAEQYQIPMTFFVDAGFIWRLELEAKKHPELQIDLTLISDQLKKMEELKCEIQFHVHPHWENAKYANGKWDIDATNCYKLADFPKQEAQLILQKYFIALQQLVQKPMLAYRAGGWCAQPFELVSETLKDLGICIDSSVFPGGYFTGGNYDFDFRSVAPFSKSYRFEKDVCIPESSGSFTEAPIASWYYSPLFYWKLYIVGRLFRSKHKMLGDGTFLAQPGRKKSVLTSATWNHVSTDGYYAKLLQRQAEHAAKKGVDIFVVIGHPKGLTNYSLQKTEEFIKRSRSSYSFISFSQWTCN